MQPNQGRIHMGEWRGVAISFVYFFCVLAAYYMIRPVREQLSSAVGSTQLPWFYAATFIATLVLTPLCMDVLLFKNPPRGAPRCWHLLGTTWVILYLAVNQVFLYYLLRPILKIFTPRNADDQLRRATRWMARGLVKGMPFGKLEFQNISPATFSPPCIVQLLFLNSRDHLRRQRIVQPIRDQLQLLATIVMR